MEESQFPRYPRDKIATDTRGAYPISYNRNKYLIRVMDLWISYPETYSLPDKSVGTVAKMLNNQCYTLMSYKKMLTMVHNIKKCG